MALTATGSTAVKSTTKPISTLRSTHFDELNVPAHHLENAATRVWARLADAFNAHDVNGFLALSDPSSRLDDRRKGLGASHEGAERERAAHALFEAPESWRMEIEPLAIRGSRISLVHMTFRDVDDIDRPITAELLAVMELGGGDLAGDFVNFDVDDIDEAYAELDARTSRAKPRPTRAYGRSSCRAMPRSTDANCPRSRRTG